MKMTIRTVAICATLGLLAISCQKESMDMVSVETTETIQTMEYSIDDAYYSTQMSAAMWSDFINKMLDLAEQGHNVTLYSSTQNGYSKKEIVTYTTSDRTDAAEWCSKMKNDGYSVNITFDSQNKVFICTATK